VHDNRYARIVTIASSTGHFPAHPRDAGPGHGRLTGVFSPVRASRGERVGLRFDPDGCHVFARPQAASLT